MIKLQNLKCVKYIIHTIGLINTLTYPSHVENTPDFEAPSIYVSYIRAILSLSNIWH